MKDYFADLPAHIRMSKKARFNYIMEKIEGSQGSSSSDTNSEETA